MLKAFELQTVKNEITTNAKDGKPAVFDSILRRQLRSSDSNEFKEILAFAYIEAAKAGQRLLMLHLLYRQRDFGVSLNHADYYQGLFEICKTGNFTMLDEHGDFDRFIYPKSLLCHCLEQMFAQKWQNDAIKSFIQNFAIHTKAIWFNEECMDLCQQNNQPEIGRCLLDSFKAKSLPQKLDNLRI